MLVSSITRFNAINTMNNASMVSMQTTNSLINAVGKAGTFAGENDLSFANEMDKKFCMDLLTNNLLYKLAYMQEKMTHKNNKNSISYIA